MLFLLGAGVSLMAGRWMGVNSAGNIKVKGLRHLCIIKSVRGGKVTDIRRRLEGGQGEQERKTNVQGQTRRQIRCHPHQLMRGFRRASPDPLRSSIHFVCKMAHPVAVSTINVGTGYDMQNQSASSVKHRLIDEMRKASLGLNTHRYIDD